ncbi:MAG: hypothetical protein HOV81_18920 [Kofleriaceae bacterium]|nr:hypothetical protein [Kofleriaceae bacterium]
MTSVYIDGERFTLAPAALLGQGGEAEVYDLGDGRVLKWWKPADHPDFDGLPAVQDAVKRRLAEQPEKLRALPGNLPPAVVAPCGFALAGKRSKDVVGYLMPKVGGTPLHSYGEPRWRRDHPIAGDDLVAVLLAIRDSIAALHRAGVVVGDCNDLNILVDGRRVHLIDVDSYQYAGFTCSVFSERFVDPRVCSPTALVPIRPHDEDSDWFAFAAMAFRTLLGVGPWGGVAKSCAAHLRALKRLSVLADGVVYPRAARPIATLPDELVALFREIFERDLRGDVLGDALARLRLRRCTTCGDEHARVRCPTCQALAQLPPAVVHGRLRYQHISPAEVALATIGVGRASDAQVYLDGGALMRRTPLGPERIGSVLAGQTRAWLGTHFGIGFYRAGGYAVGFTFRPDRGVLDDRIAMPKLRGQLVASHATIGDDRAWLWLTCADAGRITTTCIVVDAHGTVLATETLADNAWLAGIGGACAAGSFLFVPTDDGVTRVEIVQNAITATRVFAETASLVGSADRLALCSGGLDVIRRRDAIRMQLT